MSFADGEPCAVFIAAMPNILTLLIGQYRDNSLGHLTQMSHGDGKIHPARHVMGWCDALNLFRSANGVSDILKTKAQ